METKRNGTQKNVLWGLALLGIAAASFFSMFLFDRMVFGKNLRVIAGFYALAGVLLIAGAFRRPVLSLAAAVIALAALWRYSPVYVGLFFPVALAAVLYDSVDAKTGINNAGYYMAVGLWILSIPLRIYAALEEKRMNFFALEQNPPAEKYVYFALLLLLLVLFCRMFSRGFHATASKKTKKKTGTSAAPAGDRMHTLHLFCILNTLAAAVHCAFFFKSEYVKAIVLGQYLFVLFLFLRQDPLLPVPEKLRRNLL